MIRIARGLTALLIAFAVHAQAASFSDPRFFGTYCGESRFTKCFKYKVYFLGIKVGSGTRCETINLQSVKAKVNHSPTPKGGLISGAGSATVDGTKVGFVLAGAVLGQGFARGSVTVSGLNTHQGTAHLSKDGLALTIYAINNKLTLRKDQCGNSPPNVVLTSLPASPLQYGQTYSFVGKVTDVEDLAIPGSKFPPERLIWTADDTQLLTTTAGGLVAWQNTLPPGSHKIAFSATDSGGLTDSVSAFVTVDNDAPEKPDIIRPESSAKSFRENCKVWFMGRAFDREDGLIPDAGLTWTSSTQGKLGSGASLQQKLNKQGSHTIRLTATDSVGASSYSEKLLTVQPGTGACPPQVRIVTPKHGDWKAIAILSGSKMTFVGSAFDGEDPPDKLKLQWQAKPVNAQGPALVLGSTSSVQTSGLVAIGAKPTTWEVSFSATDSDGETSVAKMNLVVLAKPIL